MANFFVVFDRQALGSKSDEKKEYNSTCKVADQQPRVSETSARWSGHVESAKVVKLEAASAAEAQQAANALFPGVGATRPVSVTEANFLEPAIG